MKYFIYIIIVISLSSCGQNNSAEKESDFDIPILQVEKPQEEKEVITEEHTSNSIISSEVQVDKPYYTNGIQPDFFNINASQFSQFKEDSSKWFISSDGKSNLYFVPYTDYSITTAILTEKKITDPELISLLQFEGIEVNNHEKTIELDRIQTEKGIKLGLSINEVKKIFGIPDSVEQVNDKDLLEWRFVMLENEESNKVGGLKPFVLGGLEFLAEMEFTENKLIKVVYKYEVP